MERRGVALEILDGIDIGMEDIRTIQYLLRRNRHPMHQVVVVGIHTGNHIPAQRLAFEEVHQHRLLPTCEFALRRQHHLEVALVVLKLREHRAPEIDIIIALDIGYNPMPCLLRCQRVRRFEVPAIQIILQSVSHQFIFLQRTTGLKDSIQSLSPVVRC